MIKIGITGQAGFIGTYLYNYLDLKNDIESIAFNDSYFDDEKLLDKFVSSCDVIVHLAAMNRHENPQELYDTNIRLVTQLIESVERTHSDLHILMSSSAQETRDNLYGKSKFEGRRLFIDWSRRNHGKFTGLIIPNVFGPFGKPYYNSVVATFAYQLTHNETPSIDIDAEINLIYIHDLIEKMYDVIINSIFSEEFYVEHNFIYNVSDILNKLKYLHKTYYKDGVFPELGDYFNLCLFNTYRSFLDKEYFPRFLKLHSDERGSFVEIAKSLNQGQFSFSTTKPGITRGNHFHLRKVERFSVIKGEALIQLRKIGTNKIIEYKLTGEEPSYVDIPIWHTHNIKNIGYEELYTLFWTNEFFNVNDMDTYFEDV